MRFRPVLCGLLMLVLSACDRGDGHTTGGPAPVAAASMPAGAPLPAAPVGGALRYLALGDSYTKGEGVAPAERWPVQLAAGLRATGLDVGDPQVVAETGWRTDDLAAGIDRADPRGPFQLVSLLIGVNDQHQGRSVESYRAGFEALLRRAVALAGGEPSRVLVLSIPDWGATPMGQIHDAAGIGAAIDRFNAVNRELSRKAGVRYVDVTPLSRTAAADPALTVQDELHPSGRMYAKFVQLALPAARDALGGGGGGEAADPDAHK